MAAEEVAAAVGLEGAPDSRERLPGIIRLRRRRLRAR